MGVSSRPWICLSSSSGMTFSALFQGLSSAAQNNCLGFFTDRSCGAVQVARELLGEAKVHESTRSGAEAKVLEFRQSLPEEPLVLLCGYFGILTANFLTNIQSAVVNTHPSLLPAFPGMDKKVHAKATESVAITGFTLHLVTEVLDGGPVLFQHPVWIDPDLDAEQNRLRVREAEQRYLPLLWEKLLQTDLNFKDSLKTSKELRSRLKLNQSQFSDCKKDTSND